MPDPDTQTERCEDCDRETLHKVWLSVEHESDSEFSREPYRVAECQVCGHRETKRMNNA